MDTSHNSLLKQTDCTFTPQSVLDVADLGAGLHHPQRGGDALLRPPLPLQSARVDLHRVTTGEVFVTNNIDKAMFCYQIPDSLDIVFIMWN